MARDPVRRITEDTMTARDGGSGIGAARVLDGDEVQGVLSGSFYSPLVAAEAFEKGRGKDAGGARSGEPAARADKPTHYKVICISMYTKDLERLDTLVEELKARGLTKASRSALIRAALDQVDLDKVPRGM
jgi:hypothetical protein